MHVFTYGTLMFPQVWQAVVGPDDSGRQFAKLPATLPATLPGYQIFRVAGAVYPGIIKYSPPAPPSDSQLSTLNSQPSPVPGLLYLDVDPDSIARVDRFEDGFYRRQSITVTTNDGRQLEAQTYVVPGEHRHVLTADPWTADEFEKRGDLARFVARYAGFQRLD
jgi:gamma-glutamylcyclotransferase (GGCT)/AIG2-like uncharacterized protein YtfP